MFGGGLHFLSLGWVSTRHGFIIGKAMEIVNVFDVAEKLLPLCWLLLFSFVGGRGRSISLSLNLLRCEVVFLKGVS